MRNGPRGQPSQGAHEISGWQRRDIADQFWFVQNAVFLVGEDAVVGEVLFPWRLVAWNDGVVKLLSPTDQFVLRNWNIGRVDESYCVEKCNER